MANERISVDLFVTHMFDRDQGRYSILSVGDRNLWLMEREWNDNRRNVSCVPRDNYTLVRHHGTKYRNTWRLEGPHVGHGESGKRRTSCCFHKAVFPTDLEGCLCVALAIDAYGMAIGAEEAGKELLAILDGASTHKLWMQGGTR